MTNKIWCQAFFKSLSSSSVSLAKWIGLLHRHCLIWRIQCCSRTHQINFTRYSFLQQSYIQYTFTASVSCSLLSKIIAIVKATKGWKTKKSAVISWLGELYAVIPSKTTHPIELQCPVIDPQNTWHSSIPPMVY